MADEKTRQFIDKQLRDAGVRPSEDAVLDYAMCTIELLTQMNMKLHERIRELQRKRKKRVRSDTTRPARRY